MRLPKKLVLLKYKMGDPIIVDSEVGMWPGIFHSFGPANTQKIRYFLFPRKSASKEQIIEDASRIYPLSLEQVAIKPKKGTEALLDALEDARQYILEHRAVAAIKKGQKKRSIKRFPIALCPKMKQEEEKKEENVEKVGVIENEQEKETANVGKEEEELEEDERGLAENANGKAMQKSGKGSEENFMEDKSLENDEMINEVEKILHMENQGRFSFQRVERIWTGIGRRIDQNLLEEEKESTTEGDSNPTTKTSFPSNKENEEDSAEDAKERKALGIMMRNRRGRQVKKKSKCEFVNRSDEDQMKEEKETDESKDEQPAATFLRNNECVLWRPKKTRKQTNGLGLVLWLVWVTPIGSPAHLHGRTQVWDEFWSTIVIRLLTSSSAEEEHSGKHRDRGFSRRSRVRLVLSRHPKPF